MSAAAAAADDAALQALFARTVSTLAAEAGREQGQGEARPPPPPLPVLSAETAQHFVAEHEALVGDETFLAAQCRAHAAAEHAASEALARLRSHIFAENLPLKRVELQALQIRAEQAQALSRERMHELTVTLQRVQANRQVLTNQAIDIMLSRPAQTALLEPGAPLTVVVDTPTLGRAVSDAESLNMFGLNLSQL